MRWCGPWKSGQLAGYAGDVWFPQPPAKDHPWRTMPHHGMTPHISGSSLSAQARYAAGTREILDPISRANRSAPNISSWKRASWLEPVLIPTPRAMPRKAQKQRWVSDNVGARRHRQGAMMTRSPLPISGRKVMEWFSRRTSIAGNQIPNWMVVLGAVIVILLAYSFMH